MYRVWYMIHPYIHVKVNPIVWYYFCPTKIMQWSVLWMWLFPVHSFRGGLFYITLFDGHLHGYRLLLSNRLWQLLTSFPGLPMHCPVFDHLCTTMLYIMQRKTWLGKSWERGNFKFHLYCSTCVNKNMFHVSLKPPGGHDHRGARIALLSSPWPQTSHAAVKAK